MDRVTYHDQTDMQNVLKLREVFVLFRNSAGIIFGRLMQLQRQKPGFHTHTIYGFFSKFWYRKTPYLKVIS